jgi:dephospho-CoA kinase
VIGLVGEIGAGKSQVAALLAARGALVLDADAIGHTLLTQRPVREPVVARFGPGILQTPETAGAEPMIDRRLLGKIVFSDPAARRDLEAIVHPRMRRTFEKAIARAERLKRVPAVVLDAAILFEVGWDNLCDKVLFVQAPRDLRLSRVAAQRGWTEETLRAREDSQWPAERKRGRADAVVTNDSDLTHLAGEVDRLWPSLISMTSSARVLDAPRTVARGSSSPSRESSLANPARTRRHD